MYLIIVRLNCSKDTVIDSFVTVVARGSKKMVIPVRANAIIPDLKIEGDEVNFGSMPVCGNPNKKTITLINDSPISASLELVLHNDSFLQRCLTLHPENTENLVVSPAKDNKERKAKIYSIKIEKKCRTQLTLEFTPEEVKEYVFLLPIFLAGSSEHIPSLQKDVKCRSLKNRLVADRK